MIQTVSELTKQIKQNLEEGFQHVSVIGEISNFKPHVSGNWYFNLKDSNALLCCTMWKGFNNYVFFTPQDGIKVIANGKITVYPPRGYYQLDVKSMKPAGIGELQTAFERLKQKLSGEGLFDRQFKKPVPSFPRKIGIVTAVDGAAFQDMINIARRRYPAAELIIAPARVQGSGAAESIVISLRVLNEISGIDVIIVARGGGSIEDLWAFNEEIVARAIFKSRIPVITGIGHEIDFTIADFTADLRAPTPSAAMELATPDKNEILGFLNDYLISSRHRMYLIYTQFKKRLEKISTSYGFKAPMDLVRRKSQNFDNFIYMLFRNMDRKLFIYNNKIAVLMKSVEVHDIRKTLKKGFVLVKQDSKFVTRSVYFDPGKSTLLRFYDNDISIKLNEKGG
jgi:exodeoxyribonuclease VII large subunit